ncbi:MAG: glycoside hydrolase family 38 C-terminal domain-containing protein [Bacteroidota bacterium]
MSNTEKGKKVHIISNTHWDRAWVYPFNETRLLLVEFMDNLLELLETDQKFHSFLLDSQTIAVEDYLEFRPEKEDQIKKFVKEGKLIVGPWYNLPEEYIVNGESLVRNMVVGHRQAEKLGKISKIGYTPFSYGQTSQMPQIYNGFDIDTMIFYRGINTKKAEFVLEGPDGSRLLGCRFGALSRFSYYFYVYRMARFGMGRDEWWYDWDRGALPFRLNNENHSHEHYYPLDVTQEDFDLSVLPQQVKKLIDDESEHFSTSHIACMQGFDCSSPDPKESLLAEESNKVANKLGHELYLDSLENFMNEMKKEVKDPEVLYGESRNPGATGKWTNLMGDVISSRTKIKRRNAQGEVALQRYAEPFSTLGWLVGGEYMKSSLDMAWKYLLQNHPHDNICGAGIDQMEKDMMYRFDQTDILSNGIMRRGLSAIVKQIDNNDININEAVVTVFNPSPFPRTEVVTFAVDLPDKSEYDGFSIRNALSEFVPFTQTSSESYGTLVRNLQDISLQLRSQRVQLSAEFTDIPAFGYKTYLVKKETETIGAIDVKLNDKSIKHEMENEFIKVSINKDGSINILDKNTGQEFVNQNYYEETGESGNPWIHMFPEENKTFLTLNSSAEITHLESSAFLTKFKVVNVLNIPVGLEGNEGNYRRSDETTKMKIETIYTLRKNQPFIEVNTKIENNAEHHRVRAMFPTNLDVKVSAAEAAFDVIERNIVVPESSPYYGKPNPQYPMHRFVDMSDEKVGLTLFNDGIREYEALVDESRTLALTLFRGFTATQSPVIDQWDVYPWMKLSQSLGHNEWRYAIMPHSGDWVEGNIYREVERFNLPIEMAQSGKGGGSLSKEMSFISINSEKIALSSLKQSEKRESLILRLFNPTDKEINCHLTTFKDIDSAWLTNMNEERIEKIENNVNSVSINFSKKKIITLELVLSK